MTNEQIQHAIDMIKSYIEMAHDDAEQNNHCAFIGDQEAKIEETLQALEMLKTK